MKIICLFLSLFFLGLGLIIPGCTAQPHSQISGQIELDPGWKPVVYLIQPRNFSEMASDYLGQLLDSAIIAKDGSFIFEQVAVKQQYELLELVVQKIDSRYANHLIDTIPAESNYMPVILENGSSVKIQANISSFQNTLVFINPSSQNKSIISLRNIRLAAFKDLLLKIKSATDDDSLLIEREQAYDDYIKPMMEFADSTSCLEAAMLAIRWISPTNDFERIPEFTAGQCQLWSGLYPEHPYAEQICVLASKNKLPLMKGDIMPDFSLPLVTGDTVNLFSLLGRKLTLLDFWASWCAPCRKENREELIPLWNTYHDKGFQIIAYSLDASEGPWKNAIKKDGSVWTQASHLSGDSSPFMEALRITTIPANYILDADGKIIARNLHGKDLKYFIEGYQ